MPIKAIVNGTEKEIMRIPVLVNNVYKDAWEVRDNQDRLLWYREDTLTGTSSIAYNGYGIPLKSMKIVGNGVQNGTPSPDSIIMPDFCGVRTGNLFPQDSLTGKTSVVRDTFNKIASSIVFNNGQYNLSMDANTELSIGVFKLCFTYTDDSQDKSAWITKNTPTIMLVSNGAKVVKSISITDYNNYTDIVLSNIMLNSGSTLLPYEPYGWKLPITNTGQTVPIYLGEVPTVRRIKKLVLDGTERWKVSTSRIGSFYIDIVDDAVPGRSMCDRAVNASVISSYAFGKVYVEKTSSAFLNVWLFDTYISLADFKSYLAQQYAAGTPVTVWYVLATPETAIVNEPLAKIGDYADELITVPGITSQTGINTLTVDTTLSPSSIAITGHIRQE